MDPATHPQDLSSATTRVSIQRLLILHLNLAQICTGKPLGESALEEEWQEHILYYHHAQHTHAHEAVQFASLCMALCQFPTALNADKQTATRTSNSQEDQICQVQLDKSTLVFVPLEATLTPARHSDSKNDNDNTPHIIAVAQVNNGCSPLAIRASIGRSHDIFCLLCRGGVHVRLASFVPSSSSSSTNAINLDCQYPGMEELFTNLKSLRRLKEAMYRSRNDESETERLEMEERQLRKRIESLRCSLPMTSLREDLRFHYDAYLAEFDTTSANGAGSCLVETIPSPIAQADGTHSSTKWVPRQPQPHVSFHLGRAISSLLTHQDDNSPRLHAVSTFYQGQLLLHHSSDGSFVEDFPFSRLVMSYMSSYAFQLKQQHHNQETFAKTSPPRRIGHGLVSFSDQVSVTSAGVESSVVGSSYYSSPEPMQQGHFMPTPPLAMLSASEQNTISVQGPGGESVWAPLVYSDGVDNSFNAWHAIVYEWNEFGFLLYIPQSTTKGSGEALDEPAADEIETLLERISSALNECLSLYATPITTGATDAQGLSPQHIPRVSAAGRNVIFVDRKSSTMMLFPRLPDEPSMKTGSRSSKGFLQLFRPKMPTGSEGEALQDVKSWALEQGLDCRYWLASHLPANALAALDDAMDEVHSQKRKRWGQGRRVSADVGGGHFEMMTAVPSGWVSAFADDQEHEIYMILELTAYPTLTDAQNAMSKVRDSLI